MGADVPGQDGATRTGLRTFQTAFRAAVADSEGEEALNLRGGGWVVDLRGGLVRTALATAFIAGVLAASGVTGLLPLVAPAVLPLLFDVHQVRLKPSQELVLAELQLTPEARSGGLTAEATLRPADPTRPATSCPGSTSPTSSTRSAALASPTAARRPTGLARARQRAD